MWDYGQWKSEAERTARELSATTAIVRLPLLVSFEPDDHVVREIRLRATQGNKTQWFVGETRQPALAHEVAMAVWKIACLTTDERAGTWHLPGPERLTRYEIAVRIVDHLGLSRDLVEEIARPASWRWSG